MEQKQDDSGEHNRVKILIVDDNLRNLYMLEVLFKGAGYDVVSAKNGIEALEELRTSRFDGIISDILMPLMDGFRFIWEVKKDPVLQHIPFIFYTATYTEKKDEEFGLSLGAIRYIVKPAEPEELLRQVHEAFNEHAKSPRDYAIQPVPDEETFSREYTRRVGAKLEKKEQLLKEREEMFRLVFENSMDAILLTRPEGSIQAANPAACRMFGRTEEEIISIGRNGIIDSADPRLSGALEERDRKGWFKSESTFIRKDGTRFPGEISSNVFTDHRGQIRTSMIIRDITETKNLEELKISALSQIEKNLEQLATLNDQIRNPLSIIVMLAEQSGNPENRKIIDQAMEIDRIVRKLDRGWAESEKVREFLRKHYHMFDEKGP